MANYGKGQLLAILDDLSAQDLKKFHWYLKDKVLDGFAPIPNSKLENAERHDTVDKMVETYNFDGALKISVKILGEMRRNDLVVKMEAEWKAGLSDEYKHRLKVKFKKISEGMKSREERQTTLKLLEEKVKIFKEVKQTHLQSADHIQTQAKNTERNIKEQFKKLHQFLQEEEEARIAAMRKEEKQMSEKMKEKMKEMDREIASLSRTIKAIEKELRAEDISLLQNLKTTEQRAQCTLPDPQLVSGALIDVAKHLGNLTFRVWEKMKGVVKFTPVILDPNTATGWLSLSDDLTSVRCTNTYQQLPDNPERFTRYCSVQGSEGFSSGKHSWEVEVADHPDWVIGVARESVDRKGVSLPNPNYGMWSLCFESGKYTNGLGETISLKRRPQRIRVQLDCDSGEVSFYDSEYMTHIYTHRDTFTEKLYPYFSISPTRDAKHPDVAILPSE